ncbi:MAG: inositol monophosphatase [Alphaproteobacteria bacterium]|nr:inositol monophosphatase [Alphaproteobacteria bacterium]
MSVRSAIINVMEGAARKAARSLVHDFGEVEQLQVSKKGPGDFVTNADLKSEKILRKELRRARPDYGFLLEESGAEEGTDPDNTWLVDPLDGTSNFLHGNPHFSITIALRREGKTQAGIILDPIQDEFFWAERGGGAFLNDRRLRVSARKQLAEALVAFGEPFGGRPGKKSIAEVLPRVMEKTAGLRRTGAAAQDLAYVAAGRFDAYWEEGLKPWDMAAGILLVQEAGGYVTEIGGGKNMLETGSVLATNDRLYPTVAKLLREAYAAASTVTD